MSYVSVSIEGGLFPPDLVDRIATASAQGQAAADFGVEGRLPDEIQSAFSAARAYWESFELRRGRSRESVTTLTREFWVKPFLEALGFAGLQYQAQSLQAAGELYAISHLAGDTDDAPPVHIVALGQRLDARDGRRSPHAMVQEYLNRSDALWGIVTNGEQLRLLRDSTRVSHPTYVEFNLRAMVEANLYSEFVLLFRLLHATRFPKRADDAHECLLERYYQQGIDEGGRVREHLRDGVEEALKQLGTAFLSHSANEELREHLAHGKLTSEQFYRQLLRLIYRLLFLMVAEERKLVFTADAELGRQDVYTRYYSVAALRDRCERRGSRPQGEHHDLWLGLVDTFRLFRDDATAAQLGLHALNGELFGEEGCPILESAQCSNAALLASLRALSSFTDGKVRRRVNYAALDVEELGSVYESLLDYRPDVDLNTRTFDLPPGMGRKTTGSYYTPPELVLELIRTALVPVVQERLAGLRTKSEREAALLSLRVVDPASGSGHFLLAAARRIALELARVRSEEDEPSPSAFREAVRDVIRHCIYAVDLNPLAADLCKVALWIEGHSAGLPLSFLDNHVKCGNALLGVYDLGALQQGIPDEAYTPIEGDDKPIARALRDQNRRERSGQEALPTGALGTESELAGDFSAFGDLEEQTARDVRAKRELYEQLRGPGTNWWHTKVACDLWTAAFFTPMRAENRALVPTTAAVREHLRQPKASHGQVVGEAVGRSGRERFFHWPLEFPDVFAQGGFDVVLGNPPWERIKLQEQEFFAERDSYIAHAPNAAVRRQLIRTLPERNPALQAEFQEAKHSAESVSRFIRGGGRFPLCGRGDINTYAVFAELIRILLGVSSRAGCIVPTGIATDDTTKHFFADTVERRSLVSLFSFENEARVFPAIHHAMKFCLLTLCGAAGNPRNVELVFYARTVEQAHEVPRQFALDSSDFALMNPNTRTCPIFRSRRDADITRAIYRRWPVLLNEGPPERNPWAVRFATVFHMANDSELFRTRDELKADGWELRGNRFIRGNERCVPLYEGKMVQLFDHRFGSFESRGDERGFTSLPLTLESEYQDENWMPQPFYWVNERKVEARLADKWARGWLLGWRDITSNTNERTFISSVIPFTAVGHKFPLVISGQSSKLLSAFQAMLSSNVFDYVTRQKLGGSSLTYFIVKQLPTLVPEVFQQQCPWMGTTTLLDWVAARVLELTYTANDLAPFAQDLGYRGAAFRWDSARRFLLRVELDAAFFHLYGISRDDADYILDTFPIVRRKDETAFGEYRTKRVVLEIYDEMAKAVETGNPYQTRLDPPPADHRVAHEALSG